MLDLAETIDNSFVQLQAVPGFATIGVAPDNSNPKGQDGFIRYMKSGWAKHKDELEAWIGKGHAERAHLEITLRDNPDAVELVHMSRLLSLSSVIENRAERDAVEYASLVKQLRKQSREFSKYSAKLGKFMKNYTAEVEAVMGAEIEFLLETADFYRGLYALFAPEQTASASFTDATAAIAYLKQKSA